LKTFPFIKIAESARPPVALQVPRLLVSLNTVAEAIEGSRGPRRSIYYLPREQTCGTLIAQAYDDNLNRHTIATLGGIVRMQEQYFGLTAGHVFSDTYATPSFSGKCDSEFAFDGESDEISDEEDLTVITSSGKHTLSCFDAAMLKALRQHFFRRRRSANLPQSIK
jgi:hypothetical protein